MPMSLMRMNALVTERLPGQHPAHARPAEDARGRRQRRHRHERGRGVRAPARPAGRAAPPRGVSATPPDRPRGVLINTWIASELVDAVLDRNLAERRACTADFYGTLSVIGVWGPLTPSEVAELNGHAADDGLRPPAAHGRRRRRRARGASRRRPVAPRPADARQGDARWKQGWPALQRTIAAGRRRTSTRPVDEVEDALEDLIDALRKAVARTYSGFVASSPVSDYHARPCAHISSLSHSCSCPRSRSPRARARESSRRSASARNRAPASRRSARSGETNYGTATLSRVNPRTNKVTKTGRLGAQPCGIAAGAGSLWIDGYGTSRVERVNRKTLKVVKRIKVGINVWDVAFAFGSAWATNNYDGSVARINPATNRIVKTIKTGAQPTNFGIGKDAIWVGDNSACGPERLQDRPGDEHVDGGADGTRPPERDHRHGRRRVGRERRRHGRADRPGDEGRRRDGQGRAAARSRATSPPTGRSGSRIRTTTRSRSSTRRRTRCRTRSS